MMGALFTREDNKRDEEIHFLEQLIDTLRSPIDDPKLNVRVAQALNFNYSKRWDSFAEHERKHGYWTACQAHHLWISDHTPNLIYNQDAALEMFKELFPRIKLTIVHDFDKDKVNMIVTISDVKNDLVVNVDLTDSFTDIKNMGAHLCIMMLRVKRFYVK